MCGCKNDEVQRAADGQSDPVGTNLLLEIFLGERVSNSLYTPYSPHAPAHPGSRDGFSKPVPVKRRPPTRPPTRSPTRPPTTTRPTTTTTKRTATKTHRADGIGLLTLKISQMILEDLPARLNLLLLIMTHLPIFLVQFTKPVIKIGKKRRPWWVSVD